MIYLPRKRKATKQQQLLREIDRKCPDCGGETDITPCDEEIEDGVWLEGGKEFCSHCGWEEDPVIIYSDD